MSKAKQGLAKPHRLTPSPYLVQKGASKRKHAERIMAHRERESAKAPVDTSEIATPEEQAAMIAKIREGNDSV